MSRQATSNRPGPRPLPLYLATAATSWLGSRAAFTLWKNGSLPWRPDLQAQAESLRTELESLPGPARSHPQENQPEKPKNPSEDTCWSSVEAALAREIVERSQSLMAGILAYRDHPHSRDLADARVVWQQGSTRLLDYGGDPASMPLLVIPSLINRYYVLDLDQRCSLLRHLVANGFRPFMVDWGRPGAEEQGFTLTDYISGRLNAALDVVLRETGGKPALLGYCMGGLLALALAQKRQADLSALVLMATPWDFSAEAEIAQAAIGAARPSLEATISSLGNLPTDAIQGLFHALDPMLVLRKFLKFSNADLESDQSALFVALEDWLNDGVPLAASVAREALFDWYLDNTPARLEWRVDGEVIDPASVELASLVIIPARDRIVPPGSAAALAHALPNAEEMNTPFGHIGMVVGGRAPEKVWTPLMNWLETKR
jgi:polyhydroxyalkanoate synthase